MDKKLICTECGGKMSIAKGGVHVYGNVSNPPVKLRCDKCDITRFENREDVEKELADESKEGSEESSNVPNQQPKVKRNIGCGVILILVAFGTLFSFIKGGTDGNASFLLGGLLGFAVMIYFSIRIIKGKEIKD